MHHNLTKKEYNIVDFLAMALLFLFAADAVNRYFFFLYGAFFVIFIFKNGAIRLNGTFFFLVVISLSMFFFNTSYSYGLLGIIKCFVFMFSYLLGYNMIIKKAKQSSEKTLILLIAVITLGTFLHLILNMSINMGIETREPLDYWTKGITSATLQAAIGIWAVAVGVGLFTSDVKARYKIVGILFVGVVMFYNLILAGRTLVIMFAIIVIIAVANMMINNKTTNKTRVLLVILLIAGIIYIMFQNNIFGLRDMYMDSNYYDRMYGTNAVQLEDDSRLDNKIFYLKNISSSWFGGDKIRMMYGGRSAHDLYLDTHNESGIFALISLLSVSVISVCNLVRIMKRTDLSFVSRQMILCIYLACHIEFFVEPIMRGMPWLYAAFCILDGAVRAILDIGVQEERT